MVSRLTLHNFYKVEISEAANKLNATPASIEINSSRVMTASTLKLATDLFTWHC